MSRVVHMLEGDGALPQPKEPGFFTERKLIEENKKDIFHQLSNNHKAFFFSFFSFLRQLIKTYSLIC
ncbi:hypothetical protein NC653_004212 [Populus alba x Populus x berolinensis]|uniref:S-locus receptor kinase C-terminal domain-containing protein n=1 Tax=Populus alba x Populus x berolinensis TaxID=444605 RepID=A0AAD6RTG9_9ROSI|nr:hypothetical protein NC653_004212 [Populus alba x Populus x berolinensis]